MTEPQMPTAECAICQRFRDEHRVAEREGVVNHQFSEHGELKQLEKEPQKPGGVLPVGGDPLLRYLLIQKGVVTTEELNEAERQLAAAGFLRTQDARPRE